MKKKKEKSRQDIISSWLAYYPLQAIEAEEQEDGKLILLVPHQENWFTRRFLPAPKRPAARVTLDKFGSFVWKLCDGSHSVQEICDRLEEKFGEEVQPVVERTVVFVQMLFKNEFVKIFEKKAAAD